MDFPSSSVMSMLASLGAVGANVSSGAHGQQQLLQQQQQGKRDLQMELEAQLQFQQLQMQHLQRRVQQEQEVGAARRKTSIVSPVAFFLPLSITTTVFSFFSPIKQYYGFFFFLTNKTMIFA
jgi:hypothetical protein